MSVETVTPALLRKHFADQWQPVGAFAVHLINVVDLVACTRGAEGDPGCADKSTRELALIGCEKMVRAALAKMPPAELKTRKVDGVQEFMVVGKPKRTRAKKPEVVTVQSTRVRTRGAYGYKRPFLGLTALDLLGYVEARPDSTFEDLYVGLSPRLLVVPCREYFFHRRGQAAPSDEEAVKLVIRELLQEYRASGHLDLTPQRYRRSVEPYKAANSRIVRAAVKKKALK